MVALTETAQSVEHYIAYLFKDLGQPHYAGLGCGYTTAAIIEYLTAYRELRNDLTRNKIVADEENAMRLVLDHYNAYYFPLQTSFLTALHLYLQDGHSVLAPGILKRHPMNRDRAEAYWAMVYRDQISEETLHPNRGDVSTSGFGLRPMVEDHSGNFVNGEGAYESEEEESMEYGHKNCMSIKEARDLAKEQYRLQVASGLKFKQDKGQAFPKFDQYVHRASGQLVMKYAGVQYLTADNPDVHEVFTRMQQETPQEEEPRDAPLEALDTTPKPTQEDIEEESSELRVQMDEEDRVRLENKLRGQHSSESEDEEDEDDTEEDEEEDDEDERITEYESAMKNLRVSGARPQTMDQTSVSIEQFAPPPWLSPGGEPPVSPEHRTPMSTGGRYRSKTQDRRRPVGRCEFIQDEAGASS